jgi:multicomponent Na+:H+ antiporter subunit A
VQPSQTALVALLALPFLGAAITPLVYRVLGERTAYVAAAVALACFGLVASQFGTHGSVSISWIPAFDVSLALYVDGLSLLIGFLASGVGVLIFTYSGGYMHGEPGQAKYYATLLAFMGSMLGVAFTADLIALFLFWELTSVASFLLIGHYRREDDSLYASRKSMLITVAGGLFMLVGFLLLHAISGSALPTATFRLVGTEGSMIANAEAMRTALQDAGLFLPVLALVGIGAAAKSAQVPLHIWLPNAMEAPTPVSAFLHSATMVKAGVYLVGRFRPLLVTQEWMLLFAVLGLVTMTVTAILAVAASDIKELLAYSTASHLGLIIAGYGVSNFLGAETGAFHILNHAVFKATLFLVAGIIAHEAGTRAIDELGGLRADLPITAGITVVAALGMAGVPPFNGFFSKEFLFEATYEVAHETITHGGSALWWLLPAIAVFGSVFTFLYSIRFLMLFFGDRPDELGQVHTPPATMLAPPLLLAGIAAVIGLGGVTATFGVHLDALEGFVGRVVESSVPHGGGEHGSFSYHIPTKPKPPVIMSVLTIALGLVAYPFYDRLRDGIRRLLAVGPLSANWYYEGATSLLDGSTFVRSRVQTGKLRTYGIALFLAVSAMTLGSYLATGVALPAIALNTASITVPMMVVLTLAVVAAIAIEVAPSHVAGVLTLSILGFMVAIFYILASAPDLALTQLVVETLVLVIFLLVLDKLPAFYGETSLGQKAKDGVVAGLVGVTVFVTVLVSTAATPEDAIASYFVERAGIPAEHGPILTDWGGGGNIVNVILVDFRAFDTLGEISVVAMAALSVVTIVAMRERGETQ